MKHTLSIKLVLLLLLTILQAHAPMATAQETRKGTRPQLAVLEFKGLAGNQWWSDGGAEAVQSALIAELTKSKKFRVVEREQLLKTSKANNLPLGHNLDATDTVRLGKLWGVNYLLTGSVTEYGVTDRAAKGTGKVVVGLSASLIDTSTGEVVWADEARRETDARIGVGGNSADSRLLTETMMSCVSQLVASIKTPNRTSDATASDARITAQIKSKLAADGDINPYNISVNTNDGVVTLKGTVAQQTNQRRAEQIAREVPGVRRVVNRIKVGGRN